MGFKGSARVAEICKNLPKASDVSATDAPKKDTPVKKGKGAKKKGKGAKKKGKVLKK